MALADILADHPHKSSFDFAALHRAIRAATDCAVACTACADSDLARDPEAMQNCIRRCLNCSDLCTAVARILSRPDPELGLLEKVVAACAAMCSECAKECESHIHLCCQECAAACRECEKACQQLLAAATS